MTQPPAPTRGHLIELEPGQLPPATLSHREWIIPPEWMTVREYAVMFNLSTTNVAQLGQCGKVAMAAMRAAGITTVPQVWEQATTGQWFKVNVLPFNVIQRAAWSVW